MIKEIIHNPVYLVFLLIVLFALIALVWSLVSPGTNMAQWIIGYFKTLFGGK